MHRLDKLRVPGLIPQHPPQLPNRHRQDRLTHRRLRPDAREEGLFGEELPRPHHQGVQHPEGFVAQGQDVWPAPQALVAYIEAEGSEDKVSCSGIRPPGYESQDRAPQPRSKY